MKKKIILISILIYIFTGCTSIITAPIDVTSSVVSAGFHMVGAAGGAVTNIITGGSDSDDD